jgi:heme exporter protein D
MDWGPHTAFVIAAYGIVALVLAGLVAWLAIDGRRQQRMIDQLEARGVTRRSARERAGAG